MIIKKGISVRIHEECTMISLRYSNCCKAVTLESILSPVTNKRFPPDDI